MSHIDHLKNYYNDLLKAQHTPLLIELNHTDINALTPDQRTTAPLSLAKSVFDRDLKNQTSIILIDGDDARADDQFFLLDRLLEQLRSELKEIKNLAVLKESLKGAASVATGGMLGDLLSNHLDNGLSFVLDEIGGEFSSLFSQIVFDNVDVSEQLLSNIEGILHDCSSDTLGDLIAKISKQNLFLSTGAKSDLNRLSNQFSASENIDLFQLAFKLLLAIAIDSPKLIYINNPHRLDSNSIAILSLLFSYAKNQKEQDQHIGLSVVYAYSAPSFDLYQEASPELTIKQQLLSDQRRFVQRYAMLERPSSDIPNLAVKSSLFIGRQEELHTLNRQYVTRVPTTLSVIAGEPGIGKTALVNQHIKTITKNSPAIVLTLLNEVGHSSSNTGLSSLEKSIIEEEKRLHHHRNFKEKTLGFLRNLHSKETVFNAAGLLLSGADKALNIIDAGYQRIQTDGNLDRLQKMGMQSLDNKQQDEKERQFNKLDNAITLLSKIHIEALPIILFIDDLQWIDDTASEYILTRLLKRSDIYVIATLRPSDAATQYKAWQSNLQLHRHALSLLTAAKVTGAHEFSQSPEVEQLPDCSALHVNTLTLSGFDKHALTQLIAKVISGTHQQHHQLAEAIVSALGNATSIEVNTLFAVETINMLCDAKLYRENRFEQLILSAPLRFNPEISDINATLKQTFESLQRKYQDSLVHASQTGVHQGFNLMAYAVLEERLHLLKIYFGEMGNAAVNTLLFSSLLGAPFSSELVKCVLNALSTTNEPKLQSLKSHILQHQEQVNLQPEHYAIIDEVYEILRRLGTDEDRYQYSHGLLHIFLDKQFDYLLDKTFTESNLACKDTLILLILTIIRAQQATFSFSENPTQSITRELTSSLIIHQTVMRNVLAKGYSYHPDQWAADYIKSLTKLATLYMQNNQLEKAINLFEQSLDISRHYYQQTPDQWAKDYTTSLINLAGSYAQNDRLEKGIDLLEECLDISQHYYQQSPDQWAQTYSTSLNNLAGSYRQNNQLKDAIALLEQCAEVDLRYYQQKPDQWAQNYSTHLNNLAASYEQNNQREQAIALLEQCVEIGRHYYLIDPDQWAKIYNTSVNTLAFSYRRNNQFEKATALDEQSLEIAQHYYQKNPDQWAQNYTSSLRHLAASYEQNNQYEKAIALREQSLEISQCYYQKNPNQWAMIYTNSLSNLAGSYEQNNQLAKAIVLESQSLEICRRYYQQTPDQWIEAYITSLNNLANSYQLKNQFEKAIILFKQSLEVRHRYYEQNPDQWAESYTTSLSVLANSYQQNNQFEKAIIHYEQSLEIRRHYYQKNPDQWAKSYTIDLSNLAYSYEKNNQLEIAIALQELSLNICQHYYQKDPNQWSEGYNTNITNLVSSYCDSNQIEEAARLLLGQGNYKQNSSHRAKSYIAKLNNLAHAYYVYNKIEKTITLKQQSLKICQQYYQQDPGQWAQAYITILSSLVRLYEQNNQVEKAVALQEESLGVHLRYCQTNPCQWGDYYTISLLNFVKWYRQNNELEKAISLEEQSLSVCARYYQQNPEQWAKAYTTSLKSLATSYKQQNPDRWAQAYSTCLNNLVSSYKQDNSIDEAIALEEQFLDIQAHYYQQKPDQWAREYTTSLNNLARSYYDSNQLEKAIALEEQSLEIRASSYQKNPDQWAREYTFNLNNLARSYYDSNQFEKAIALEEQSLEIQARYYQKDPDQWAEEYSASLNNLATSYSQNNQLEKAVSLQEQSLKICQQYYQTNPQKWAGKCAAVLNNLAASKTEKGSLNESLALAHESLAIYEGLFEQDSFRWLSDFLSSLYSVATKHLRLQHYADAIRYFNDYFKHYSYQNIEHLDEVTYFIYPIVNFIQAARRCNDSSFCDFKLMVDDYSSSMIKRFGALYQELIVAEQTKYSTLADSDDPLLQEKYHILMEFFATDKLA